MQRDFYHGLLEGNDGLLPATKCGAVVGGDHNGGQTIMMAAVRVPTKEVYLGEPYRQNGWSGQARRWGL